MVNKCFGKTSGVAVKSEVMSNQGLRIRRRITQSNYYKI